MNIDLKRHEMIPAPHRSDEIDLTGLAIKIWQRKSWVVCIALMFVAGAMVYVQLAKPTYRLEGVFRPVLSQQFTKMNLSGVIEMTPEEAMKRFLSSLESRGVRRQLFDRPGIGDKFAPQEENVTADQLFAKFNADLKVAVPVAKKGEVLISDANYLTFHHENPDYGVEVVNALMDLANVKSVVELSSEYISIRDQKIAFGETSIANKIALAKEARERQIELLTEQNTLAIKNIQDQLEVAREKGKKARFDRMKSLQESIAIATALKIETPMALGQQDKGQSLTDMLSGVAMESGNEVMYLRGVRFLSSELHALQQRENDDFADPAIRELEAELELLKRNREVEVLQMRKDDRAFIMEEIQPLRSDIVALQEASPDFSSMKLVRIDQPAIIPEKPIKPQKILMIVMAGILGVLFGIFTALVMPRKSENGGV